MIPAERIPGCTHLEIAIEPRMPEACDRSWSLLHSLARHYRAMSERAKTDSVGLGSKGWGFLALLGAFFVALVVPLIQETSIGGIIGAGAFVCAMPVYGTVTAFAGEARQAEARQTFFRFHETLVNSGIITDIAEDTAGSIKMTWTVSGTR